MPKVRRDTYLDRGPEVMDFIKAKTPVRFTWVPQYADYHPEAPGGRPAGRSSEPIPLDARFLGDELDRLHPPYTKAPANLIVTQADYRKISLGLRTIRGPLTMAKVLLKRIVSLMLRPARCTRWATRSRSACARAWSTPACRSHYETELTGPGHRGRPRRRRPRHCATAPSRRSAPAAA